MASKKKKDDVTDGVEQKLYSLFLPLTKNLTSKSFEEKLEQADIDLNIDMYFSKNIFLSIFIALMVLLFGGILLFFIPNLFDFQVVAIISLIVMFVYFIYSLINPYIIVSQKVRSIKNNLSLVILGMSSVVESGAPPETIFSTSTVKEKNQYVDAEFSKIIYYINSLGISLLEAINIVAKKTPSMELKQFLLDLKSNIEAGGSLPEFMKKKAEHAKFKYNLLLQNQNKRAELFGDIYSAVVIAGPLFLFSGIMLLGMVGGGIGGMSISSLMIIGIFLLVPIMNIFFLIILNILGK